MIRRSQLQIYRRVAGFFLFTLFGDLIVRLAGKIWRITSGTTPEWSQTFATLINTKTGLLLVIQPFVFSFNALFSSVFPKQQRYEEGCR